MQQVLNNTATLLVRHRREAASSDICYATSYRKGKANSHQVGGHMRHGLREAAHTA